MLDLLAANPDAGTPVLHWFTGSRAELARAVDQGCFFSVGPGMLKSVSGIERLRAIPLHRLLTETDGPFVKAMDSAAGPWDIPAIVEHIALKLGSHPAEVEEKISLNFRNLASARFPL